ncbi:RagB/SusD family nutrient uptake outer membrane protein [Chitinophaga agrisoli]|uniref:RagB/SusD family nutrient uptake outer membrane protein n=1 Tax=Chitinophaga agrisoli TaxID=2607653 RepID=A0A5B2VKA7_9BACT|nr:RagB/SusD family nutrient uptake outer membrane protein [Chitinophaga agrisoli]KAA2240033.1 RagB/SusD family nutrient uptake outer membrane protein [Chitinophaga agrisoli]
MKKLILSAIILTTALSCSKSFLDREPIDRKVDETFYKTPQDALEALTAAYDELQYGDYDNIQLVSEIASDDCFGGGGESDIPWKRWDRFENDNNTNLNNWTKYYTGIYRANIVIAKMDGVNWGADTTLKTRYLAEAHFLRAYYYFDLVRMFGNVPLVTAPLSPGQYNVPQAKPEEVYQLIANDLKFAADKLPSVAYAGIPAGEYGRVTKWAAEALLGRVFLYYTGYYGQTEIAGAVNKQQVRTYIDDVINASGYNLVDTFPRLWQASLSRFAGEDNVETVFAIKFTYKGLGDWNKHDGNRMQVMIGFRNDAVPPYYKGWGAGPVNPKLWAAYEPGDTRRAGSIISVAAENLSYPVIYPQKTNFMWKKYMPMQDLKAEDYNGDFQIDNFYDYVAIRFADVLLMGAELNLDGDLGKAQLYYNRVRDRAFLDQNHRRTLTPDAAGKKLIMDERRVELALEGHRYWDLLRQGIPAAKLAIDNTSTDPQFNVVFRPETKGLFQIPQQEINLSNGSLQQNTGWNQ